MELEEKFIAKTLALSAKNEMTSGPFITVGTDGLSIKTHVVAFVELAGTKSCFQLLIAALCIF